MSSESELPKQEPQPTALLSSIPQKRALDDGHSPAIPSPLNTDGKPAESNPNDDASAVGRSKPSRTKKETLKKREAKGIDSTRVSPDPKASKEPKQSDTGPLRYKLAPPKPSDFEQPRGPVLTSHHEVETVDGKTVEFLETSEQ